MFTLEDLITVVEQEEENQNETESENNQKNFPWEKITTYVFYGAGILLLVLISYLIWKK